MTSDNHKISFEAPSIDELTDMFPGHRIESLIAQGGMGAVYLASQTSLDRQVAIKILPKEFGEDPGFREAFQAEAKAMAKINHPNLVSIYDFGSIQDTLYIVMEYASGSSLFHLNEAETLEHEYVAQVGSQIALGLAAAHEEGILHRDIKPSNILLNQKREAKISDFGLARPTGHVESGIIYGTPGYTAPEVIDSPDSVCIQADIFSVGIIVYELLAQTLPTKAYMPVTTVAGAKSDFDNIIRKAIHPSPKMRYKTAQAMGEDLKELANDIQREKKDGRPRLVTGRVSVSATAHTKLASSSSRISTAAKPGATLTVASARVNAATKPGATISAATGRVSHSATAASKLSAVSGRVASSTTATSDTTAPVPIMNRPTGSQATLARSSDSPVATATATVSTSPAKGVNAAGLSGGAIPQTTAGVHISPTPKTYNKNLIINLVIIVVLTIACLVAWNFVQKKEAEAKRSEEDRILSGALNEGNKPKETTDQGESSRVNNKNNKGPRKVIDIRINDKDTDDLNRGVKTIDLAAKERTSHEEARKQLEAEQLNLLNGIVNIDKLPNNTITRGGKFYLYINQKMTWHEADSFCNTYGGQIATCSQLADASFLKKHSKPGEAFWLGGGATPSKTIEHVDSSDFKLNLSGVYGAKALSFQAGARANLENPNEQLTFFVQWNVKGDMHSTLDSRLTRLYPTLDQMKPKYPPLTKTESNHNYLVVFRKMSYKQAETLARLAGGHLAVISSSREANDIEEYLQNALPDNTNIWAGYKVQEKKWGTTSIEETPYFPWSSQPSADSKNASIKYNGSNLKLEAHSDKIILEGCLIEWSSDEYEAYKALFVFKNTDNINSLKSEAKQMIQIQNKYFQNLLKLCPQRLSWIIRTWKNGATKIERQAREASLSNIISQLKSQNKIPESFPTNSLPQAIVDQVIAAIDTQTNLYSAHTKQIDTIRDGYINSLRRLYEAEPNKKSPRAKEIAIEVNKHRKQPDFFEQLITN